MYSVSLLPSEYKNLHKSVQKSGISLVAAMIVMGILLAVYLVLSVTSASKSAELSDIQFQNSTISMKISELENLDVLYNNVTKKLADAMTASGTYPSWDKLVASVGNSSPESLEIKSLVMRYSDEKKECIINGIISNHEELSQWMDKLNQLEMIEDPTCTFSSRSDDGNNIKFELIFVIKPGMGYTLPMEVANNG